MLLLILGAKTQKSLEVVNLSSSSAWFDTYQFVIRSYLNPRLKNFDIASKVLNRKTLKKTIMTTNYSATLISCFNYFLEDLEKIHSPSSIIRLLKHDAPEIFQPEDLLLHFISLAPKFFQNYPTLEGVLIKLYPDLFTFLHFVRGRLIRASYSPLKRSEIKNAMRESALTLSFSIELTGQRCMCFLHAPIPNVAELRNWVERQISRAYLFKLFQDFFNFTRQELERDLLYSRPSKGLVNIYREFLSKFPEGKITLSDNCVFAPRYLTPAKRRIDVLSRGGRLTTTYTKYKFPINFKKTNQAIIANITHAADAWVVRELFARAENLSLTIHDSFGVEFLHVSDFIVSANYVYYCAYSDGIFLTPTTLNPKKIKVSPFFSLFVVG